MDTEDRAYILYTSTQRSVPRFLCEAIASC